MSFISLITGNYRKFDIAKGVFTETETYEKGFSDYYEKNLKPLINSFEENRLHALKIASIRARISILIVIALLALDYFLAIKSPELIGTKIFIVKITPANIIMGNILLLIFLYIWIYYSTYEYESSIKSQIFPSIISFFGQYKYQAECGGIITDEIQDSDIIPLYDCEISTDQITGDYKGVSINLFQTLLLNGVGSEEEGDPSGKKGSSVNFGYGFSLSTSGREKNKFNRGRGTAFKGVIITCNIHKNFSGKTLIKKDSGNFGNLFKEKPANLEHVRLEDPKFEKMFEVYSTDQIEARYLLTTSFMERLINLAQSFKSKTIECSFYNNKLLMMIPMKQELFETGSIYKSEDFADDAKIVLKSMNVIFAIIDQLKLYQNIGM